MTILSLNQKGKENQPLFTEKGMARNVTNYSKNTEAESSICTPTPS